MDRMACVDVPGLDLQLLLRRHPDWASGPAAVVDQDKPQGLIVAVNRHARGQGVRVGMRYAAGLSLASTLKAGVVPPDELEAGIEELVRCLRTFSPQVEPCEAHPGVFWLDASGLRLLYSTLEAWAWEVRESVAKLRIVARVAVGFSRLGSWVAARTPGALKVFDTPAQEHKALQRAPLAALPLPPQALFSLEKLGVASAGAFMALPAGGLGRRLGPEVHRLHRMARGTLSTPLQGVTPVEPLRECILLDDGELDVSRLLFLIKRGIDALIRGCEGRGQLLAALTLRLALERSATPGEPPPVLDELLRPAAPTTQVVELMNLVRLRLESLTLPSGVIEILLGCEGVKAGVRQGELFVTRPKRSPEAAARALARVRAELGAERVVTATLTEGHLPEARFAWTPLEVLPVAKATQVERRPMIRRVLSKPIPLKQPLASSLPQPPAPSDAPPSAAARAGLSRLIGPHTVSGGWWANSVHRDYYFAEMADGAVLWIYYDNKRERWLQQGHVE